MVKTLITANLEACRRQEDKYGFTPLHIACFHSADEEDDTPRNVEEEQDVQEIVQALLQAYPEGASIQDDFGWVPLHIVCRTYIRGEGFVKLLVGVYPQGAFVWREISCAVIGVCWFGSKVFLMDRSYV